MLLFIETICYEKGAFQRIDLHEDRMNRTREHFFGSRDLLSLEEVLAGSFAGFLSETLAAEANYLVVADLPSVSFPTTDQKIKCRVTYSETIESIEFEPYIPKVVRSLQMVTDDSIDYGFKNKDRRALQALLNQRGDADEILIVKNGLVTDTSYSNMVFLKEGKWYTPKAPLLPGTRRADYLRKKLIIPTDIRPGELSQFEEARMINAMLSIEESVPIKIGSIFP